MLDCKSALLHLIHVDGFNTEFSYMQSLYKVVAKKVVLHEKYAWL